VMFDLDEDAGTITVTENGSRMALDPSAVTPPAPETPGCDRPPLDRADPVPLTPGQTATPTTPGQTTPGQTTPGQTTPCPTTTPATPTTTTPAPAATDPTATDRDATGRATTPLVPITPPCSLDADAYVATCAASGIARIRVTVGNGGSDVRIRADLPARLSGGDGDDLLIGGPAADTIDGGRGRDVIGGGGGADELHGGRDDDLLTYIDRIRRDGELLPRRGGVVVRPGARGASGSRGERDTIFADVEQFEGGGNADRFELRDGRAQSIACNAGRDVLILDPLDDEAIDCESAEVGAAPGERMSLPVLVFPFPDREDRARGAVTVKPVVPLQGSAIVLKIRCQVAIGLLAADGPGCRGRVRMTRAGGAEMAEKTIEAPRGREIAWRVPLTSSLSLARRAGGLPVTVSAFPSRGAGVRRDLRFTVKG
jgi:hemolysin type calcium-binding protein